MITNKEVIFVSNIIWIVFGIFVLLIIFNLKQLRPLHQFQEDTLQLLKDTFPYSL